MSTVKEMKGIAKESVLFKASLDKASDIFFHAYKAKFAPPIEGEKEEGWHQFSRSHEALISASNLFIDVNYFDDDGYSMWVGILEGGNRWVWLSTPTGESEKIVQGKRDEPSKK
jgi:hypothetical protein